MSDQQPSILEFLFVGPLFSLFKGLNQIRRDIMGLKEQIDGYTAQVDTFASRVSAAQTELSTELQNLTDALANADGDVDEAVQSAVDALGTHLGDLGNAVTSLEGVEKPPSAAIPPEVPVSGGSVVDPTTLNTGTPATDSPGEPSNDEVPPENV